MTTPAAHILSSVRLALNLRAVSRGLAESTGMVASTYHRNGCPMSLEFSFITPYQPVKWKPAPNPTRHALEDYCVTQTTKLNSESLERPVIFQQPSEGRLIPFVMNGWFGSSVQPLLTAD